MTIGTGIFLGCIFLGLIYLYLQTRDRWSWKKIIYVVLCVLAVLILAILFLIFFKDTDLGSSKHTTPKISTSLLGINLGDKFSDVQFRVQSTKDKNQPDPANEIWYSFVNSPLNSYAIDLKTNRVSVITLFCTPDGFKYPSLDGNLIHGIKCGDKGETLDEKFVKEKARVLCLHETDSKSKSAIDYASRVYD